MQKSSLNKPSTILAGKFIFIILLIGPEPKPKLKGDSRTFRVFLDPNQYQQDMTNTIQNGTEDVYETFNVIMRRKPKENNFKVGPGLFPLYVCLHNSSSYALASKL